MSNGNGETTNDDGAKAPGEKKKILPNKAVQKKAVNNNALINNNKVTQKIATARQLSKSPDIDTSLFKENWIEKPPRIKSSGVENKIFRNILKKHNSRLEDLHALHAAVKNAPDKYLKVFGTLYKNTGGPGIEITEMREKLKSKAAKGTALSYLPWDAWWAGEWINPQGKYFVLHVWDPTVNVGFLGRSQHVQMVTQVGAKSNWFASANQVRHGSFNMSSVDFAINVWSEPDGLTGWVRKTNKNMTLPHVAYLLDPETLLWFTIIEETGKKIKNGEKREVWVFAERVYTKNGERRYFLEGAIGGYIQLNVANGKKVITFIKQFKEISKHKGRYYGVAKFANRSSLEIAEKYKHQTIKKTPKNIIKSILNKTK